jgi:hypothetical protein
MTQCQVVFAWAHVLKIQSWVEPHFIDVNVHFEVICDLVDCRDGLWD